MQIDPLPPTSSRRPQAGRAVVVAIINNKGGVGKTTTAVSLAAALTMKYRVLLVDVDGQGSASYSLGVDPGAGFTLATLLEEEAMPQRVRRPTAVTGLDLIAGGPALMQAELRMSFRPGRNRRLARALEPLRGSYDVIVLDCPPSMSTLSRNALCAADGFIVPVVPQHLGLGGLVTLLEVVKELHADGEQVATLWGIVLTMVDVRTRVARELSASLRSRFGGLVFRTEIPYNVSVAEAPGEGRPVFETAMDSAGARAYWALTKEVATRIWSHPAPPAPWLSYDAAATETPGEPELPPVVIDPAVGPTNAPRPSPPVNEVRDA